MAAASFLFHSSSSSSYKINLKPAPHRAGRRPCIGMAAKWAAGRASAAKLHLRSHDHHNREQNEAAIVSALRARRGPSRIKIATRARRSIVIDWNSEASSNRSSGRPRRALESQMIRMDPIHFLTCAGIKSGRPSVWRWAGAPFVSAPLSARSGPPFWRRTCAAEQAHRARRPCGVAFFLLLLLSLFFSPAWHANLRSRAKKSLCHSRPLCAQFFSSAQAQGSPAPAGFQLFLHQVAALGPPD